MKLLQQYRIYKVLKTNEKHIITGNYYNSVTFEAKVNDILVSAEKCYPDYDGERYSKYSLSIYNTNNGSLAKYRGIFAQVVYNLLKHKYGKTNAISH